jgi:ribosome biogenesis GTPase
MLERVGTMTLDDLGWRGVRDGCEFGLEAGEAIGRVALEHRGRYVVATEAGELAAEVAGRLRHEAEQGAQAGFPAVGDWVVLRVGATPGGLAVIRSILPRSGVFVRKVAGRGVSGQVVAANVDFAFLVMALTQDLNPRRLERYVALAYEGDITPVIVLNKADLPADEAALEAARARAAASAPGVPVHAVSALTARGLEGLEAYFHDGRTIALLGSSGVGKSTLINRLLGCKVQEAQDLRVNGKGKHTTTHRALLVRPGGGLVIDTPGMRELGLFGTDEGVGTAFPDVEELAAGCKFRDCTHRSEPGCAVQAAVRSGRLPADRLASHEKLLAELRQLEAEHDPHARLERKRQEKLLHRAYYRWVAKRERW